MPLPKDDILGAPVSVATLDEMADRVISLAADRHAGYVCVVNVHLVVEARRDPDVMAALHGAVEATSDGMPLVWELRRRGHEVTRVYGPDLTLAVCARAERAGLPVAFYGGSPAAAAALERAIAARFPQLRMSEVISPPMLPADPPFDPAAAERVAATGAPLVFVGLGCPKQELWMARHSAAIPAVLVGVGAAFDFIAGAKPQAPAWMRRSGLEWLFRLASEPRRLWRRYLVTNSVFAWAWLRERLGAARRSG